MKYVQKNMLDKPDYTKYDAIVLAEGVNDSIGFTTLS